MPRSQYVLIFPERSVPRKTFFNCDYCVNHWGTDICACGSGEKYQVCVNDFDECGRPMQELPSELRKLLEPPPPEPVIKPFIRRQRVLVRT